MAKAGIGRRESEVVLLVVLVAATAFTILVVQDKLAFLSFFQIPVLVAAYFLGRRQGVLVAVLAVLMVGIYATVSPSLFAPDPSRTPATALFIWGGFMIITAYVVGTLYEAKEAAVTELRAAYAGVIDILSELIDAVDQYANNHSVRVAELGAQIGVVMNLENAEIENIRVAGLLHDIRQAEVSIDVLRRATESEPEPTGAAAGPVERRLSQTGGLLRNVVPLIETYQERFDGTGPQGLAGEGIPLGARILAAANDMDRMVAPEPYGDGLGAADSLLRIEKLSGSQFDPRVIDALIVVMESRS